MNIQDFNSKNRSDMTQRIMVEKEVREFNNLIEETNQAFPILESVLDPIQKYRCPTLFGENNKEESPKIKPEARKFLMNIAEKFIDDLQIPGAKIQEFFMIGSSLGYQYRADADIDCDLRINVKKEDMWGKFSLIPKGIIYPGTSQPVNIFLLCEDDAPYDFENHCENAYDLLENKWIKQGYLRNEYPIPYSYVAGVSEFIMDGIALQLQRADRHIQDVHKYIGLDPEKVEISARERADAIADGINDLKIDADALNLSHHFLFRFDGEGFNGEEFRISIDYKASRKHYTINNLIYKYVDGFGYYDKVNAKIKEIWTVIEKAKNELEKSKGSADEERDQERVQKELLKESISTSNIKKRKWDNEDINDFEYLRKYHLKTNFKNFLYFKTVIDKTLDIYYHDSYKDSDLTKDEWNFLKKFTLYSFDGGSGVIAKMGSKFFWFSGNLDDDILNSVCEILNKSEEKTLAENLKYSKYGDQERVQDEILKEAESVESVNDKTTVLNNLRSDIQDEYTAIKGYDAHADFAEKNGCSDIAKIIRDIRDEEKVHIGELEAVMKKYDKEFKASLADGGKEAEEILKESKKWNIKDFNNTEALGKELARLHAEKEKHLKADDMPSMYYENIDSHIKQLTNKMKEFDCKCEKITEAKKIKIHPDQQSIFDDKGNIKADLNKKEQPKIKNFRDWTPEEYAEALADKDDDVRSLYESRLPDDGSDPQFGVPQQKKYPLFDKAHVEAAIKLFGHVDAQYEQQLARAIIAKMKKYDIPYDSVGKDNKLYKWIPEKFKNAGWKNYLEKYD